LAPENSNLDDFRNAFVKIEDLSLDGILLDWEEICLLVEAFPNITTLSANSNELEFIRDSPAALRSISMSKLTSLKLEYNEFTSLGDLWPLAELHSLERLHLGGNKIKTITSGKGVKSVFGKQLQCVDISYNNVIDWDFVDQLSDVFPGITALRISHNPIYGNSASNSEEYYMLTLARIANLKSLNFCHITPAERTNAEIFYLYRIGQAVAAVTENEKHNIIAQHRRFKELCKIHEPPTVTRANSTTNPGFLEGRLINFTFYMPLKMRSGQESKLVKMQEIPKGFDMYQVKGIVGELFSVKPLGLRLIWETGEWDPVAGYEDERESSSEDEDHDKGFDLDILQQEVSRRNGKWIRREVELEDGTRQVGFWIDGMEAKVRVELR
jgi:tubulin-specific chaperone E